MSITIINNATYSKYVQLLTNSLCINFETTWELVHEISSKKNIDLIEAGNSLVKAVLINFVCNQLVRMTGADGEVEEEIFSDFITALGMWREEIKKSRKKSANKLN